MQWFLWGVQDILNLVLNKNEVTKNNNSNKKARVNFLLIQNKTACNNNHRKSATVAGATSVCTGTAAAVLLLCRSLQSRKGWGWGWGWKWAQGWGCRWRWAWGWGWVWSLLQFCCPQETTVLGTCPLYLWDGCNVRSYLWFWQAHMHKIRLNERPIVIWRGNY